MLSNLVKQGLRRGAVSSLACQRTLRINNQLPIKTALPLTQVRTYYPDNVLMPREYGDGYFCDPKETAERVVRLISLHDNLKINPSDIEVGHSFDQLGLNALDM